jgi:SPP1 gp7 family putative phage head morphogenesis protein
MATAAQLAQRRALVAAATRRRLPRPAAMLRAQLPRPIAYTRALTDVAAELNDALAAALSDELGVRVDAADGDATVPPFNRAGLLARLHRLAAGVVKRRGSLIDRAIDACAEGVASKSKAEWARQAKAAVGIDLAAIEPNLTPTINAFRRANLELITSMAKDKVERVKALLTEHAGARVETLRDRIMEEQGVTKRQAALIARDQVLSLNAQVTQKRHAAAGVSKYIWRTSGDGDVRPAHRALDGKVFSYDDPPVVDAKKGRREHPGEDYQCRCTAEPIIPGFDDESAPRADAGDFKESQHPRAKDGQFTAGGGSRGPLRAKEKDPKGGPPEGMPTSGASTPAPKSPAAPTRQNLSDVVGEHRQAINQVVDGLRPREDVPPEVRARAAQFFRETAAHVGGAFPVAAEMFNHHRADYLEGKTDEAPGKLDEFCARRGIPGPKPRPKRTPKQEE